MPESNRPFVDRAQPYLSAGFLLLALALFGLQAIASSPPRSAAFDEEYHLTAGYAYLRTGDFRLSTTIGHPPLLNVIGALPLLSQPEVDLPLEQPAWQTGDYFIFSDVFIWQTLDQPHEWIVLGRLAITALGILLVLVAFVWTRQLAGGLAAGLALLLAVLDPNLITHSRLITTDLGLTLFVLLAMWRVWAWLERPNWLNVIWVGLAAGLAMASKFTGLLLWPMIAVIIAIYPGYSARRWLHLLIMGLVAYLVVWAVYGFDFGPIPGTDFPLPVPAPAYPYSIWDTFVLIEEEPVPAFLLGQVSPRGWWYYFPVALLVKTPLPLLLLTAVGAAVAWRRHGWRKLVVLWLPPATFMGLAMTGRFTIGYRHILPMIPFLIILAGHSARLLEPALARWRDRRTRTVDSTGQNPRPWALVPGLLFLGLLVWQAISLIQLFPHYEAYFNEMAGGPEKGGEVLVDSNIDWGQDLPALKDLLAERGIDEVNLAYFGTAMPEAYGLKYKPLPGFLRFVRGQEVNAYNPYTPQPGWYAISLTSLRLGLLYQKTGLYEYFQDLEPVAKAGYSINLYRVDYPEGTPVERTVVTGRPVFELTPEELGLRPGQRVLAKWSSSPETTIIPAAKADEWAEAYQPLAADFGEAFSLVGYQLDRAEYRPGEPISLSLIWRAGTAEVANPAPASGPPLAAFIHLTGEDPAQLVAQYDGWAAALATLEEGDLIAQQATLFLPGDVAPGTYYLRAGLYSPHSLARLPVTSVGGGADAALLAPITIQ